MFAHLLVCTVCMKVCDINHNIGKGSHRTGYWGYSKIMLHKTCLYRWWWHIFDPGPRLSYKAHWSITWLMITDMIPPHFCDIYVMIPPHFTSPAESHPIWTDMIMSHDSQISYELYANVSTFRWINSCKFLLTLNYWWVTLCSVTNTSEFNENRCTSKYSLALHTNHTFTELTKCQKQNNFYKLEL